MGRQILTLHKERIVTSHTRREIDRYVDRKKPDNRYVDAYPSLLPVNRK
jgi:hypothetical protein